MAVHVPHLTRYQRWLSEHRGLQFDSYDALWQWSITDLRAAQEQLVAGVQSQP